MQLVKEKWTRSVALMMVLALVAIVGIPFGASPGYAATASGLKPVYISGKSYIALDSADIIPSGSGNTLRYTITFHNNGSSSLDLSDYWARLVSTSGTKYSSSLIASDKTKSRVAAGSTETLTFYSKLPAGISLSNLVVKLIKFDFSVAGYERTIGQMKLASYSNVVKAYGYKAVNTSDTTINMRVNKAVQSVGVEDSTIDMEFVMRNVGKYSVTLANYKFFLQTASGSMYELKLGDDYANGISLAPQIKETVDLSLEIPKNISTKNAKLVVAQTEGEAAITLPIQKFALSFVSSNLTADTYTYKKGDYSYQVKVASVYKYPWMTNDNLIAKVSIKNNGKTSAPMPTLATAFYLDNSTEIETKAIPVSNQVSISAGSTATVYYYGTISSSNVFSNLKLKLYSVGDNSAKKELAKLTAAAVTGPKPIAAGTAYSINDFGKKALATVTNTRLFEGEYNDLYAVYMDITNDDVRAKVTDTWAGYLKAANGNIYDASIVKTPNTINASKKEQVIVTAHVPKGTDLTGASLVLGLGFNDTGIVTGEGAPVGYLNAANFALPAQDQAATEFGDIKVGPYTIDISYLNYYLLGVNMNLNLTSNIERDPAYDAYSSKSFKIALEDESTNSTFYEATFGIDGATGDYAWKTGDNYTEIDKDTSSIKISKEVTLNVYEVINGYEYKLVSKNIESSNSINWAESSVTR